MYVYLDICMCIYCEVGPGEERAKWCFLLLSTFVSRVITIVLFSGKNRSQAEVTRATGVIIQSTETKALALAITTRGIQIGTRISGVRTRKLILPS